MDRVKEVFSADYLWFYDARLTDEVSDADAACVWRVLRLSPGMIVLDLACGHGRIANRLAARGARVTGLDAAPLFLDRARRDAAARGVKVEYLEGDMATLPWASRFDAVVLWFNSLGYGDDSNSRRVLAQCLSVLRPGGRLLIETIHKDALLPRLQPSTVEEVDGDLLVQRRRYDPLVGGLHNDWTIVRDGVVTGRATFFNRLFAYTELRDWLQQAGFESVQGMAGDGSVLTAEAHRLIVVARRP